MQVLSQVTRADLIRRLNDKARQTFTGCVVVITAGFEAIDPHTKALALFKVRTFKDFDEGNDPHGDHDMVFVEVDGERYWAKVDYYDRDIRYLSDDPSDSTATIRVMTIGHSSEY